MYYVYCQVTGDELTCDTEEEAIEQAKTFIHDSIVDHGYLECVILKPYKVVIGESDIAFTTHDARAYEEEEETVAEVEPTAPPCSC